MNCCAQQHVYLSQKGEQGLCGGMIAKDKWRLSSMEAKVLAWDGKSKNGEKNYDT